MRPELRTEMLCILEELSVELFVEQVGQVVYVGADEAGVGADLVVQDAGEVYGGVGEVHAGGLRVEAQP